MTAPTLDRNPRPGTPDAGRSTAHAPSPSPPCPRPPCCATSCRCVPIAADAVRRGRAGAVDVLHGDDDRLLVVVGPCSIHDDDAALRVRARASPSRPPRTPTTCCVVMRTYFEKPRTTVGWKGLINDPRLDGILRRQPRAADRPPAAARHRRARSAGGLRVPRPDHPAVHRRHGRAGARSARGRRRARCTASSRAGCRCRWASRTGPTATSGSRSTRSVPPGPRTRSWASRPRASPG